MVALTGTVAPAIEPAWAKLCGVCPVPASSAGLLGSGSTEAVTARPTQCSIGRSSSACASTSRRSTMLRVAPLMGRRTRRSFAACVDGHVEVPICGGGFKGSSQQGGESTTMS